MKLNNILIAICILFASILLLSGCQEDGALTPKPRAFPKIIYPEKTYTNFKENYCDFNFNHANYAQIQQDTLFFDEKPEHPCWFDIYMPVFNARVHCSYSALKNGDHLYELTNESYKLANKHNIKAQSIDDYVINKPQSEVYGFAFDIGGPVASPFQFFLTDSTDHFLRGALYFNTQPRPDSLAPVINFIKQDIMEMINTFEWKS